MTSQVGKTIGVRLNVEAEAALEQEALRRGLKPTTAARELILEALSAASSRNIAVRLEEIEAFLGRIERELPDRIAISLSRLAPMESPDVGLSDEPPPTAPKLSLTDFIKAP